MEEERIIFFRLPTGKGQEDWPCIIADSEGLYRCWHDYDCQKCDEGISRQEAIEKMAKAFFPLRFAPLEIKGQQWDDLNGWQKGNCLRIAEAALNALLEGK